MRRTAPSRARRGVPLGLVVAGLLLLSGCGGAAPEPLKPMAPEVPADLCATVPAAAKAGLVTNSSTDTTGNPTAACSLRSPDGTTGQVRAVVTWVQLNDDATADDVLSSQCRSIDKSEFKEQAGFAVQGADRACAGSAVRPSEDSATLAAVKAREVVTVRYTAVPPGNPRALQRAQQMLEGVLSSVAG